MTLEKIKSERVLKVLKPGAGRINDGGGLYWDSPNITDTQLSSRSVFQTLPGSIH